jgi:hypothetical protein
VPHDDSQESIDELGVDALRLDIDRASEHGELRLCGRRGHAAQRDHVFAKRQEPIVLRERRFREMHRLGRCLAAPEPQPHVSTPACPPASPLATEVGSQRQSAGAAHLAT